MGSAPWMLTTTEVTELRAAVVAERDRTVAHIDALTRDLDEIVEASSLEPPDDEHDPDGPATVCLSGAVPSC
jgi:hypothetical protein